MADLPSERMDLSIIGKTGLRQYGGFLYEEFLHELQGSRGRQIFREMAQQDPICGAVLRAIEMLCRKVKWYWRPTTDDPAEADAAEFLNGVLTDMSLTWPDTIAEILSFLPYGFAPFEIIYKTRNGPSRDPRHRSAFTDGKIGWRKLSIRAQDSLLRWEFDDEGGIQGMWQIPPPTYELIFVPIEKMLLFRTEIAKGNPEGVSILRTAYLPWYYKRAIEKLEGIGIERDLAGLPMMRVPGQLLSAAPNTADAANLAAFKRMLVNVRRDEQEGLMLPSDRDELGNLLYEFSLLTTGGSRQFDTDKTIARHDSRIAMSMLADFIMLGQEAVGSFALAEGKIDLFGVALGAFLDHIASVVKEHGAKRLLRLNGMAIDNVPDLMHSDVRSVSLAEIADLIQKLAAAGAPIFPNARLMEKISQISELPFAPEYEPDGGNPANDDADDDQPDAQTTTPTDPMDDQGEADSGTNSPMPKSAKRTAIPAGRN